MLGFFGPWVGGMCIRKPKIRVFLARTPTKYLFAYIFRIGSSRRFQKGRTLVGAFYINLGWLQHYCAAHKSCLRRFPHRIRNCTFLVDRTHRKNHTACHLGYNMDLYHQLKAVNSQQAEQITRSLRSLSVVLAYSSFV